MPRILVIADEFQLMVSEEHNRKIANYCGGKLADFISLSRVYGIHFILATQTMSRLNSGFAIRKSGMRIRGHKKRDLSVPFMILFCVLARPDIDQAFSVLSPEDVLFLSRVKYFDDGRKAELPAQLLPAIAPDEYIADILASR